MWRVRLYRALAPTLSSVPDAARSRIVSVVLCPDAAHSQQRQFSSQSRQRGNYAQEARSTRGGVKQHTHNEPDPAVPARSTYRRGGQRDARAKLRQRPSDAEENTPLNHQRRSAPASGNYHNTNDEFTPRSRRVASSPPPTLDDLVEAEADVEEVLESTESTAEFWKNFPLEKKLRHESQGSGQHQRHTSVAAAAHSQPSDSKRDTNRSAPSPLRNSPPSSTASSPSQSNSEPRRANTIRFDPEAAFAQTTSKKNTATPPPPHPTASKPAPISAPPTQSTKPVESAKRAVQDAAPTADDLEATEAFLARAPTPSLNRDNIRLGMLLPSGFDVQRLTDDVKQQEQYLDSLRAEAQQVASDIGAELITHALNVDLALKVSPVLDVTADAPIEDTAATSSNDAANTNDTGSSQSMIPVVSIFESTIRHSPVSNRWGKGAFGKNFDPEKNRGSAFFINFYQYFNQLVGIKSNKVDKVKHVSKSPLVKAVAWRKEDDANAPAKDDNPARPDAGQLPQVLDGQTVVDATAGFAVDTFALAALGARVVAFENFPLFRHMISQAVRMIKPQTQLNFLTQKVSFHFEDSCNAMKQWAQVLQNPSKSNDAANAPSFVAAIEGRPDVVYLDLFPIGGEMKSTGNHTFQLRLRARYLKLLCSKPTPTEVNEMLEAALSLAGSHVVCKFPRSGLHYRPGDAIEGQENEQPEANWEVARIYRHSSAEYVVYTRPQTNKNTIESKPVSV